MGRITRGAKSMNRKVNAVVSAGADEVVGTMQAGVDNILDRALDYTGNVVKGHVKVRTFHPPFWLPFRNTHIW